MEELKEQLNRLLLLPVRSEADLVGWYRTAQEIEDLANVHRVELPEVVWHYLSDADIRYKDPEYGHHQIEGVHRFLGEAYGF